MIMLMHVFFSVNAQESFDKFIAALKQEFLSHWNVLIPLS